MHETNEFNCHLHAFFVSNLNSLAACRLSAILRSMAPSAPSALSGATIPSLDG
jgi:hypothetical protein